ncbi:hypothetical protein PINS_up024488 [Pythium insidiosum]|nr:hypothetical protein PINS_up024488 [Pythium insidiosum]
MQPTIHHIGRSKKGQQLSPLFAQRNRAIQLVKLIEYLLPMTMRRWVVARAIG